MQNTKHKIEERITKFGTKVTVIKNTHTPLDVVSIWLPVGSRFDPIGKEGLAHFFEHLLMIKTKKFPIRNERLELIESNGLYSGAFTSIATTHYFNVQPKEKTRFALDLLMDGFNNSIITKNDIDSEKAIVLDEEARNRNDPSSFIWRLIQKAIWPGDRLGHGFYGNYNSINSISEADMRIFFNKYYFLENANIIIVGNQDIDKIVKSVEKNFSKNRKILRSSKNEKINKNTFKSPISLLIEKRDIKTTTAAIAFRTCSLSNNDWILLNFLTTYLANGWISKLIQDLRIKNNYTYWVNGFSSNFTDTGYMYFTYSTEKEKVKDTLKIVFDEIERTKITKITNSDLFKYKQSYIAQFVRNNLINPSDVMLWYGGQITNSKKTITIDEFINRIKKIESEDIQKIAQKYLINKNRSVVLIGNNKKSEISTIIK